LPSTCTCTASWATACCCPGISHARPGNHSQLLVAKLGRGLSRHTGGPTILVGEEVTAPGYHLIAVGIEEKVSWRQPVARAIEDVHAQGGVAIAAHPLARFWPAFDEAAQRSLDGAELMHPVAYSGPEKAEQLLAFYHRGDAGGRGLAPIGSSDYHVLNGLGLCRTYVFARENSEAAIVAAVRDHRTVVYDPEGKAYGDRALVELLKDVATTLGPEDYRHRQRASWLEWITRTAAWFGLLGLVFFVGSGARVPTRS
jgi:hypothetical protein